MVYIDEMFIFNAIIDYILLALCNRISFCKAKRYRIFLASLLGGFLSCIGYIFRLQYVVGVIFALFCSFIAFGISVKMSALLIVVSSAYSGLLEMASGFIDIHSVNGFGYIDFSLLLFIILSILIYFPVKFTFFLYNRKNAKIREKAIVITEKGTVVFEVMIDSGCTLSCGCVPVLLISSGIFECEGNIPVEYKTVDGIGKLMCRYYPAFIGKRYFDRVAVGTVNLGENEYQGIFPMYALGM